MNQEKIGKFIAECRKAKNMTQSELAEKLGVSDKTISNWENARCMPDLSLFKPLGEILGISINELISGEKVKQEEYQEKLEENMISTIDYANKKVNEKNNKIGILFLIFGLLVVFAAMTIFPSESSWGALYSILGVIISLIGVLKLTKKAVLWKRVIIGSIYIILAFILLFVVDYVGVIRANQAPRFCYIVETGDNIILYKTPFYQVFRINRNTANEYYIVDTQKQYTQETVPNVPFNRNRTGIDNLMKYQNKYIGNNSNTGNLIYQLPLAQYGYVFEIEPETLQLTIDYHITDWYINENNYLEKSLIYNSASIFVLIDNVQTIQYNFSGKTYQTTREQMEKNYPNFRDITQNGISKEKFNQYVEQKINDLEFITNIFPKIIK